jgi:predicted MFS family arabinose efflux permease
VAAVAALFFAFYFVAYEPYRAMYPDLLEREVAGRAQSSQAVARGVGTGVALLGGGLLLSLGRPVPFVSGAVIVVAAVAAFVYLLVRRGVPKQPHEASESPAEVAARLRRLLVEHPALRAYLIANAFWEMALAGLKAFIILYLVVGLRYKLTTASLLVGGVALLILVGAGAAGKAGDKLGRLRVIKFALWAYGIGYLVPIFTTIRPLIGVAVPFIALGGGAVMTLAYALLIPLMPEDEHGALTGFYSLSRGLGICAGPIIAGVLISLTAAGPFSATDGFQAMWIVCAGATFASLYAVRRLERADADRQALRRE